MYSRQPPRKEALCPSALACSYVLQTTFFCDCCCGVRTSLMPSCLVLSCLLRHHFFPSTRARSRAFAKVTSTARHFLWSDCPWRMASEGVTLQGSLSSTSANLARRLPLSSSFSSLRPVSHSTGICSDSQLPSAAGAAAAAAKPELDWSLRSCWISVGKVFIC